MRIEIWEIGMYFLQICDIISVNGQFAKACNLRQVPYYNVTKDMNNKHHRKRRIITSCQ